MSDQEPACIVCVLKVDQPNPVPGAEIAWCEICADEVWLSPNSKRHFEQGNAVIRCIACTFGTWQPGGRLETFPEDATPERIALTKNLTRQMNERKT